MLRTPVVPEIRTDKTVILAKWFCQNLPRRLVVIDVASEQVIAADGAIQSEATREGIHFPCPMKAVLTEIAIANTRAEQGNQWVDSPFAVNSLTIAGGRDWRYEEVVKGELGVFYSIATNHLVAANDRNDRIAQDELTKLGARQALLPELETTFEQFQSTGIGFAVLFLDVDHFKRINDEHGHLAGDEVLHRVAEKILHAIRPGDGAIRYGGDEVVLVIKKLHSREEAAAVGRRLAGVIPREVVYNGARIPFTVSMGVAYCGPSDISAQAILERADRAMYRAKNRGRSGEIELD